jgi:hypothetical protein
MTSYQSGFSPVRQLAEVLIAEQVADFNQNLRDAAILFATATVAQGYGLTADELLRRWSPYR